MNNEIYLRRSCKLFVELGSETPSPAVAVALLKNIEPLGYSLSPALIERVQTLSLEQITPFYTTLIDTLKQLTGAHRKWKPMYPNFPRQVMEMSEAQLYTNAVIHYLTLGLPRFSKHERPPLANAAKIKTIELGSIGDFEAIFTRLAASKTSLSQTDKDDAAWFVQHYGDDIGRLIPAEIPFKENVAFLGTLCAVHTTRAEELLVRHIKTATDVLRLAVALCDGDVSFAGSTKFKTFGRPRRRLLLSLLERCPNLAEDMMRWQNRWIRLGEKLHPGEWAKRFPKSCAAFDIVRNDKPFETFSRGVEAAVDAAREESAPHKLEGLELIRAAFKRNELQTERVGVAPLLALLETRPGEFARRLDHLLRLDGVRQRETLERFASVAPRVSSPVLLQVAAHFRHRGDGRALRTFFPKGNVAKVQAIPNTLAPLEHEICARAVQICEDDLSTRFAAQEPLGTCWIDERLREFPVPFANRSASKALRTLARGSRLALPDADTMRFFLWWKDGRQRTDIDLSAVLYDADFKYLDVLSYYNLKSFGGHHSGDITSAPKGAAEFIDVSLQKLRAGNVRYVVMSVNSYTSQPFYDLPECLAGWMARQKADSGEIFEPRTVQDRIDLASDTQICIPLVADMAENKAIWTDIALRRYPSWNNVANNLSGVSLMLHALTSLVKPSLYDLFALHARARGELVALEADAKTVFSLERGLTPFEGDIISAHWL